LLWENKDETYGQFQRKLLPTIPPETVIGVRTPVLRRLAKELEKDSASEAFLQELPHQYFEENQLHGFVISGRKDFGKCIRELEQFLPYMDNWATCDQTSPKVFRKHRAELLPYIKNWLHSGHTYTVRFAIGMLMQHYLDEDFLPEYPAMVAAVSSGEYYVQMEIAWYFATALAKQWDAVIPYIEEKKLANSVYNKTIQKAVESYRITQAQKDYLRGYRVRGW
jgi:3-methyladenine DNA glycosylase AlkD